jgi:5-methyltetrahydrofolate--homocysteine methyltransferase
MTSSRFLHELHRRVLVLDGAMGSTIQKLDLSVDGDFLGRENCSEALTRARPDLIREIHDSFLAAGADAVETNTFGCNRLVLAEFDDEIAQWAFDLNREAAEIARAACEQHATDDKPRFVLGSLGPGTKLITLGHTDWSAMLASYVEQASGLIAGGVDALLIETCQDLLQVKCAIAACLDALAAANRSVDDIPILVSLTLETTGTMLLGTEIAAAVNALAPFPIAALGLNCATGPVEMAEHLSFLSKHWAKPISVVPNAGLPVLMDGRTHYPLGPESFASTLARFTEEYGVGLVGGCCGTSPEHIAALADAIGERAPVERTIIERPAGCSSMYHKVDFKQDTSFLIVAERTNANGSKKFRRLLNEEDYDALVGMARDELRHGSHLLDVCVDYVGRDGVADMREVVSRFVRHVDAPLMIDSTEADVIEAALQLAGGKCIVNSINLEDGEQRFEDICPLLKRYGAACVALTIDEDPEAGMAKTCDRKIAIARRIHDLYTQKWGLDERDLLIDPLTFTIATGVEDDRKLALETLNAIERIHTELPDCGVLLGVSNVSFGLRPAARAGAQLGVPRRGAQARPHVRHRPRQQDPAPQPHLR